MIASIYEPREDSFFLAEILKKYLTHKKRSTTILDMGTGSGILAKTALDSSFAHITAVDINIKAVEQAKKQGLEAMRSNLFSHLKSIKYNLILFNPPYLPDDKREPKESKLQTTAGKKGYEIITQFLEQSKNHIKKQGKILLLFSSLSKPHIILKKARQMKYQYEMQASKKLFFEELFVYEFWKY